MKKIFLFLCAVFMAASTVARAEECKKGADHCTLCDEYWTNSCKSCEDGWGLALGKCHKLPEHCIKTNGTYCNECEEGWQPTFDKSMECAKLLDHCTEQKYSGGVRKCTKCEPGWIYSVSEVYSSAKIETGCYKQTVAHCENKNADDDKKEKETGYKKCSSCEKGYGVLYPYYDDKLKNNDQQCLPCADKNAEECSDTASTYRTSTKCKSGYMLNHGGCYKEIANCGYYSPFNDDTCISCETGYKPSDDKKSCVKMDCPEHAMYCINGQIFCDLYYALVDETCIPCPEHATCTDGKITCSSGYELKDGRACIKEDVCPENAVCSDGNVTCNSGYELKDGACVKPVCPANCSACSSSTACTACDSGYSLIGGKCVAGTVAKCPPDSSISPDGCCCVPN